MLIAKRRLGELGFCPARRPHDNASVTGRSHCGQEEHRAFSNDAVHRREADWRCSPRPHSQANRLPTAIEATIVRLRATGTELSRPLEANALWCADYRGEFMLGNRR